MRIRTLARLLGALVLLVSVSLALPMVLPASADDTVGTPVVPLTEYPPFVVLYDSDVGLAVIRFPTLPAREPGGMTPEDTAAVQAAWDKVYSRKDLPKRCRKWITSLETCTGRDYIKAGRCHGRDYVVMYDMAER